MKMVYFPEAVIVRQNTPDIKIQHWADKENRRKNYCKDIKQDLKWKKE